MREAEFREWLGRRRYKGKPLTRTANSSRMAWLRGVEKALADLGFTEITLDEVHAAGRWRDLLTAMSALRSDWRTNEAAARKIAPQSENPTGQTANARAAVSLYGHFADGDDPNYDALSDQPEGSGLSAIDPASIEAAMDEYDELGQQAFLDKYRRAMRGVRYYVVREGNAYPSKAIANAAYVIKHGTPGPYGGSGARLALKACGYQIIDSGGAGDDDEGEEPSGPPISLFDAQGAAYVPVMQANQSTGQAAYSVKPRGATSNRTEEMQAITADLDIVRAIIIDRLAARIKPVAGGPANLLKYGAGLLTRYELRPDIAAALAGELNATKGARIENMQQPPTNLILYGPPGTGKTFRTAEEAVKLCDGVAATDRDALMSRYRELVEARRIDFITFHQSYSYEEFVEGLRPVQGADGEDATGQAGFSLQPEEGLFRRIAQRAAASKGGSGGQFTVGNRQLFKLSLGEAANPEDDYLFEEAISEGHALLGYDDIDWSDARFESRDAIIAACQAYDGGQAGNEPTAHAGRVQSPLIFRNWVKVGDLIIVSKGNHRFRAIGEVTSDYAYVQRATGVYSHRRKVNWLWVDPVGAPVDDILIGKNFSMRAIYQLSPASVNIPALEGYIQSQMPGTPTVAAEPFVLIIDEINRGNISKIFGELITLIEPDKRAGRPNAIEVRLPYSKLPFSVPQNLHIIGTMNTADRSIALLDTALRRRFQFREVAPDLTQLPEQVDGVPLRRVLETINDRIEYLIDREHRIGHAFFMGDGGNSRAAIDATMRDKVIPLLQEYFFEDWGRLAAVLGEPAGKGGGFLDCRPLRDPTGQDGEPRESWSVRRVFAAGAYDQLVGKPVAEAPGAPQGDSDA